MAVDMAKMICVLSKEPSHTLYLLVSQDPPNAEQDSAWMLELRYELNQVIITHLGSGTTTGGVNVQNRREGSVQSTRSTRQTKLCPDSSPYGSLYFQTLKQMTPS